MTLSEDEGWEVGKPVGANSDAFQQGYEAALKKIKDTFGNADSDSQN
jgi:hypothetical protein